MDNMQAGQILMALQAIQNQLQQLNTNMQRVVDAIGGVTQVINAK